MMENVYVIKVKTKPALSSLYPSERRYSASTVGGLSFVHFGLGALSLLLGTLALSLQGPILSVACLVPFVTGLLAWRRWYIDRNIAIFFYGSLFSLVAAILCFVATALDIAATTDGTKGPLWSLEEIFEPPRTRLNLEKNSEGNISLNRSTILPFDDSERYVDFTTSESNPDNKSNVSGYDLTSSYDESHENFEDRRKSFKNELKIERIEDSSFAEANEENIRNNTTERSLETIRQKVVSFWRKNYEDSSQTRVLLTINVLVASLLEILWSALSAKIAFRGMMNHLPETGYESNAIFSTKPNGMTVIKRKPPAPRPDILDHDQRLSESLQDLRALHHFRNSGSGLPMPESSGEFRERVERFLANQAAHRVIDGSCG